MTQLARETKSSISPNKNPHSSAISFEIDRNRNTPAKRSVMKAAKSHSLVNPLTKTDAEAREAELVIAAQAGSKEAFEELQKPHWGRLYRMVLSITKNREDAEDVLQDSLLKAYIALETFEGRSKFGSWLTRIAINTALMSIRKRHARPEACIEPSFESDEDALPFDIRDSSLNPEQTYDQYQRCLGMLFALERLDPKLQAPIRIRTMLGCSVKDIAQTLDISQATAKTRLHRGRRRLRKSLALTDSGGHFSSGSSKNASRSRQPNGDSWIAVLDSIW
jgi:RNA polymerase sigma-70 factor, ECF subfamily